MSIQETEFKLNPFEELVLKQTFEALPPIWHLWFAYAPEEVKRECARRSFELFMAARNAFSDVFFKPVSAPQPVQQASLKESDTSEEQKLSDEEATKLRIALGIRYYPERGVQATTVAGESASAIAHSTRPDPFLVEFIKKAEPQRYARALKLARSKQTAPQATQPQQSNAKKFLQSVQFGRIVFRDGDTKSVEDRLTEVLRDLQREKKLGRSVLKARVGKLVDKACPKASGKKKQKPIFDESVVCRLFVKWRTALGSKEAELKGRNLSRAGNTHVTPQEWEVMIEEVRPGTTPHDRDALKKEARELWRRLRRLKNPR